MPLFNLPIAAQLKNNVQPTRTIAQAIADFKRIVADPQVWENGQHAWTAKLRDALNQHFRELIVSVSSEGVRSTIEAAFFTARDGANDLNPVKFAAGKAEGEKRTMPLTTPEGKELRQIFAGLDGGSGQLIQQADWAYSQGKNLTPGTAEYATTFGVARYQNLQTYWNVHVRGTQRCADFCTLTVARMKAKGRLRGPAMGVKPAFAYLFDASRQLGNFPGAERKGGTPAPGTESLGDLIRYRAGLDTDIPRLKDALDRNFVVYADLGVMSGLHVEKPLSSPDHWIIILEYEGNRFGFWNAHSVNSLALGRGFGLLHFIDGATLASASPLTNVEGQPFFKNGRLTTAADEGALMVDKDGKYQLGTGHQLGSEREKRYQVTEFKMD